MQIITIYDYLLLPFYLFIFYYFVKKSAATINDIELRNIFIIAFFLRMAGCISYSLLLQYYYGYGDSFGYYIGSDFIHNQLIHNPTNIKYIFSSAPEFEQWYTNESDNNLLSGYVALVSTTTVMKISALISFLAFNKYLIIGLFFGLFSFFGQWKMFQVFNDYNKGENKKLLAYAVLYSPSIWFWGSGLMKDSICLGAMGFIIYIFYNFFIKLKFKFNQLLILLLSIYLIFLIKEYILIILIISLLFVIFVRYILQLKNLLLRTAVVMLFIFVCGLYTYFSDFSSEVNYLVEESYSQVMAFQQNYQSLQNNEESSKAGFDMGNFDASLGSILMKSPSVIFTCLFRPFIWESKKIIMLFTALESLILLLATVFLLIKTRILRFFSIIFTDYLILFAFVVSILFALIIGFTTFNFGTLIRYKIMLLPFYYFMLVAIFNATQLKQKGKSI